MATVAVACAAAVVSSSGAPQATELHESSDMREIDKMLNRIHKLTKHGYDGNREHTHHTKLAEKKEDHHKKQVHHAKKEELKTEEHKKEAHKKEEEKKETHKKEEEKQKRKQKEEHAERKAKKEERTKEKEKEQTTHVAVHHHHESHKSDDQSRPKRMALHRLAHKAQVHHATHKHVNKALEEAMAAESAAMHSDGKKKKAPETEAQKKTKENKMKKLQSIQAQITKDFASVTSFGKKAGYLPPVKMPHM